MHTNYIIAELKRNKKLFRDQLTGLPENLYNWKPQPEKWNLLEIVCHLFDEEREDFRARVQHLLHTPELPLPPIDPAGWVESRKYAEQHFDTVLRRFLEEREQSINWLHELEDPNWDNTLEHPSLGPVTARMFFTNWLAHDYLHLKQITQIKYQYLQQTTQENLTYAGEWL
jgi:DinB superfamily